MSIEAVSWALNVPIGGNQKVILLGLANHAHPDGTESYPGLDTLATYAACDRSTARRNVRKLVTDGWAIEDGLGPKGQAKYRLPLGGLQNATGGIGDAAGVAKQAEGGGIAAPPEPSFNRPRTTQDSESARVGEVWAHYQATRPNGKRCKLGPDERKLIKAALEVADVAECKLAITGLFKSSYHVDGGYVHVKYALRGGGHSPSPRATIDRLSAVASGAANGGNGRPRDVLREHLYGGVPFDDLPKSEQRNIVASYQMGSELWDGAEQPAPARANGNGNHGPALTWENFGDVD